MEYDNASGMGGRTGHKLYSSSYASKGDFNRICGEKERVTVEETIALFACNASN